MFNENAPKIKSVHGALQVERAANYRSEADSAVHRDGRLDNQPALYQREPPTAEDHGMATEDGQTSGEEIPKVYRD